MRISVSSTSERSHLAWMTARRMASMAVGIRPSAAPAPRGPARSARTISSSRRSMSSPPRCVSPLVDRTWNTPSSTFNMEMSNVPPPRSYTAIVPRLRLSSPEAGEASRVARGRALRVVEVRRHGDDRAIDLEVELTLLAEMLLGAMLQLAKHECRDFRRRELTIGHADPEDAAGLAGDAERQQRGIPAHIV